MSGATENRWRRGAPNSQSSSASNQSAQQQRQQFGTQRSGSKGATTNAWGQNKAGTNTGSGQQSLRTSGTTTQPAPETGVHFPINGYNAEEVKEYMRKAYRDAVASVDGGETAVLYKPPSESRPTKPVWGARPNFMANGRDFWVELGKQVKALEEEQKKTKQ